MSKKSLFEMLPLLAATVLAVTNISAAERIKPEKRVLWANAPAREGTAWQSSVYPLGNGRLGCTVFGDPKKERIQFNEDSLWVGNEENTDGYQPFGDLYVETTQTNFTDYRRELDISRAVQTITYKSSGVSCQREYYASHPAQVVVIRLSASKPGALSGKVSLGNEHEVPVTAKTKPSP